jgi:8-amino-3,8-dideoxy-alpha-D-manno-octulosonate transaminase
MATGATPVLAEVNDTLCLDPASVRASITPRTKVVMPVHMCGAAAELDELKEICDGKNLCLVEDACQAFGASYRGRSLGTIGDAGCYSFDYNKVVTCGEGGAIVTNNKAIYERADMYHDHGHDHSNPDRGLEGHQFPGYNYRISELHAAIGCAQIAKTERFIRRQRANKKPFIDAISGIDGVHQRRMTDAEGDAATFFSFFVPTEDAARRATKALKDARVEGVFHWYDNNWHYVRNWNHFKERKFAHPISRDILETMKDYAAHAFDSDQLISRCISITIKLGWDESEARETAERAADAIRSAL